MTIKELRKTMQEHCARHKFTIEDQDIISVRTDRELFTDKCREALDEIRDVCNSDFYLPTKEKDMFDTYVVGAFQGTLEYTLMFIYQNNQLLVIYAEDEMGIRNDKILYKKLI